MAGTIPMICPKELLCRPPSEKGNDQQDDDKVNELDAVAQQLLQYFLYFLIESGLAIHKSRC